jgi:hypothetical protein
LQTGITHVNRLDNTGDLLNIANISSVGTTTHAAATDGSNIFQVQNASDANTVDVNTSTSSLAQDGGAEVGGTTFTNDWKTYGTATISQSTASESGTYAAAAATSSTNSGTYNVLSSTLTQGTTYLASFSVKGAVTATNLAAGYLYNGTTLDTGSNYANSCSTTSVTTTYSKVTCYFTVSTSNTPTSANGFAIYQSSATSGQTLTIDNLSVTQQVASALNVSQVQIGGVSGQGLTLLTVDTSAAAPSGNTTINPALYGSIYYDTTLNALECYGSGGWGECGASPNVGVNLIPEYSGAVLDGSIWNGNDIGTLTSDICSNTGGALSLNTTVCSNSGDDYNYYAWTSPQSVNQTYSIYDRYQLPATFKSFATNNTISLTGRTTSTTGTQATGNNLNDGIQYSMYYINSSTGKLTQCGSTTTINSSTNTWSTTALTVSGGDNACLASNVAGGITSNTILTFKIDVTANNNSNAYVSNLSFLTIGK